MVKKIIRITLLVLSILFLITEAKLFMRAVIRESSNVESVDEREERLSREVWEDEALHLRSPKAWGEARNARVLKQYEELGSMAAHILIIVLSLLYIRYFMRRRREEREKK